MRLMWIGLSILCLGALLSALCWMADCRLDDVASPYMRDSPDEIPEMDVALVLGAAPIGPEGGPNRYFEYRLDAAASLWKSGRIRYLLVSGDNRRADYDEPTAMRDGLVKRGVPASAIYRDLAGIRTWDSVVRAQEIFGQRRLIIVSQRFHLARAIFLARRQGIEAWGLEARNVANPYSIFTKLRRYPSALRAYYDVWREPPPRHAGAAVTIGVDPPT